MLSRNGGNNMSECTHDCSTCKSGCGEKPKSLLEPCNKYSNVKKVIGVVSGKGGVGKSLVTSLLAITMNQRGYKTAVLDADITGPSIPKIFGIKGKAHGTEEGLLPSVSKNGIKVMSSNLLLENDTDPIVWRGPVIANLVKQFWTEVIWEDVDFLFVDMPPGTGDVPLTVFQSIGVDGIVIVTSPQELVSMIVEKAVNMANMMDIEVLGLIENYSYIECPDCKKQISVFGESKVDEVAKKYNLEVLGKLPIDPSFASLCDKGCLEDIEINYLDKANEKLEQLPITIMNVAIPVDGNEIDMKAATKYQEREERRLQDTIKSQFSDFVAEDDYSASLEDSFDDIDE
jgi:Mrp family chromosome partitioning ATPase